MTTTAELLKTPLHDWHVAHGGRMVEFGGWSMPVQYSSISEEHTATRTAVGVFDISHMGRLQFAGAGVPQFLDAVVTRRVVDMKPDQIRYSLVCNDDGGILDDVLVYGGTGDWPHSMVVNASNREKIVAWLNGRSNAATIADQTQSTAMFAVQGPKAVAMLSEPIELNPLALGDMRYYHYAAGYFEGHDVVVSRTGYTGEDGVEIICQNAMAVEIWESLVATAKGLGGSPVGLAARDTLRLEAAMPLYGHELSEAINPFQAGLSFAVNLQGREFVGRAALEKFAADKSQPVRVGLTVEGKRVPRQGCPVLQGQEIVGEVTSGTFSPTFERPIAMAYVRPAAQAVGTQLSIDIRGTQYAAVVVPLPFYERGKKS